jgi:hypothetical protein
MNREVVPPYVSVKEAVFPFNKFPGVDPILGPEMRSTGEVMGVGATFGEAMLKSQLGAGSRLPAKGTVCITVKNGTSRAPSPLPGTCPALGFSLVRRGYRGAIAEAGIREASTRSRTAPHIVDMSRPARSSSSSRPSTRPARRSPTRATSAGGARHRVTTTPAWRLRSGGGGDEVAGRSDVTSLQSCTPDCPAGLSGDGTPIPA